MSFGRNPFVAKAQDAELKADSAGDAVSEARLWFEAAHLWGRAAAKEQPGKRRAQYEEAERLARKKAETPASVTRSLVASEEPQPAAHLRLV